MAQTQWGDWAKGINCPFCEPRSASNDYWDLISPLKVSSLYLSSNQTYRGHCFLILDRRHATHPGQLSPDEWIAFCADLYIAERALMDVLHPDHINLEILGNVVPHLHWQIVPRYHTDPRWEAPIWTTTRTEMPATRLVAPAQAELVETIRRAVNPAGAL